MAIRNIIQKAEQEFPPGIKQELDPLALPELALLSGYVDTVNTNLATTGSTLNTNLATTGSTLNTKVDNLSGYSNDNFATITNLATTGSTLSTNLATTGSTLQTNLNAVAENLATTGSTLNTKVDNLSGYSDNTFYTKNNPSGFITNQNVVFTTGTQTLSGNLSFEADEYIFSGASVTITGNSILSVDQQTQTKGIVKDMGGVSGMQVLTTGAYNSITPLSGVVYILI